MRPYLLGIDIGGTKILAAVIDQKGEVIARAKLKTKVQDGSKEVVERVINAAQEALHVAQVERTAVECAGAGVPGLLDAEHGIVLQTPNMGWKDVPLAGILHERLGIQSFLCNDVGAGTWGEYQLGAGRGAKVLLGVFVGTGIGGGIIINGELQRGATGIGGEIGHTCLNPKGPQCGCGQRGCLEAYASRTAITREIWESIDEGAKSKVIDAKDRGEQIRSKVLLKGVEAGDKVIVNAVEDAARFLGIGIASAAQLLNPDRIVLGGGVVESLGEPFVDQVRKSFEGRAFKAVSAAVGLVQAGLGDDAGVLGAALLARRRFGQGAA